MIIRCPHCEYARTIGSTKIPSTAEVATCPKCKSRFRFRTLEADEKPLPPPPQPPKEKAPADIWEAVDAMARNHDLPPEPAREPRRAAPPQPAEEPQQTPRRFAREPRPAPPERELRPSRPASPKREADAVQAVSPDQKFRPAARSSDAPQGKSADKKQQAAPEPRQSLMQRLRATLETKPAEAPPQADDRPTPPARETAFNAYTAPAQHEAEFDAYSVPTAHEAEAPLAPAAYKAEPEAAYTEAALPEYAAPAPVAPEVAPPVFPAFITAKSEHEAPGDAERFTAESAETAAPEEAAPKLPSAPAETPAVFPYADDDTPPEERVERDMRLLMETGERPSRDLGRIDEWGDDHGEHRNGGVGAPWEAPEVHGWFGGFKATVRQALLHPAAFFSGFSPGGSLTPPYLFFILQSYIAIVCTLIWRMATSAVLNDTAMFAPARFTLPILLLIAPLVVGLMILFCAGAARTFLRVTAPERADFPGIFKIICYSASAFVFCVIPFLGPIVGWVWFCTTLICGFRHGLGLSWSMACLTALLPAVLLPGSMAAFFF